MKLATVRIKTTKLGSTVDKVNVTPAELMLLAAEHGRESGGNAVISMQETGEVNRTNVQEVNRLRGIYHIKKITALFPGAIPQMPEDFEDANKLGQTVKLPSANLIDHNL